jgi:malonyl-CoA/methylmalonyl-CoA synthetase
MLSHWQTVEQRARAERLLGLEKGDVLIHALPIFHVHLFVAIHGS